MTDVLFPIRSVKTPVLDVAYEQHGVEDDPAIILLHGFPYDPRSYDEVAARLAGEGLRVIVPYLRGFGATRFLSAKTLRSGQQAALAADLIGLMDALDLQRAALVGYDWGGRAACIVAAQKPERVLGLVTGEGYNIQDIPGAAVPRAAEVEHRLWYQYYFHTQRGEDGLKANRYDVCRLLWRLWSPTWAFDESTYARSAASFDNPDFVDVVIHSYRHRFGYAAGDPSYEDMECALATQPTIKVPTIALCGADDGVAVAAQGENDTGRFSGPFEHRRLPGVGHNIPQEAPADTAQALLDVLKMA